jgi:hypothetical protein
MFINYSHDEGCIRTAMPVAILSVKAKSYLEVIAPATLSEVVGAILTNF